MRIYPISIVQMHNFKAKKISERMNDMRSDYSWLKWNVGGGKSEAKSKAESQLNDECSSSERAADTAEEKASSYRRYAQARLDAQEENIRAKQGVLNELQTQTKQNNKTIKKLKSELASNDRTISHNYNQVENLKRENSELQERLASSKKEYTDIKQKTEDSRHNSQNYIKAKVKEAKNSLKIQQQTHINETESRMQNADILAEQFIKLPPPTIRNGLAQIQGYDYAKEELYKLFIEPLKNNKENEIPNGVLLFGPSGCGKTSLAKAFAEQYNHKIAYFKPTMDDDRAYNQLIDIAEDARNNYQNKGIRTFVLIDEFNSFAPLNSVRSERMKNLTDYISPKYHCSIIATTNYPEKIDPILLRDGRFEKIAMGPAYKDDLKKIIYRYLNGCFENDAEIYDLISIILNNKNGRYSNSIIKDIINNQIAQSVTSKIVLDAARLKKAFINTVPDISNDFMELFKKQIQYVQKI